jgi:protoporphyrinogen IX oxidase
MTDAIYLWIKVLHITAIISWMAGMLYLPRLFVYHADALSGSELARTFVVMERRLMRFIMLPALVVAWITGLALAAHAGLFHAGWLHGKLLLVLFLTGVHGYFSRIRKDFASEKNRRGARFYRILNEIPTVLMVGIIILVVVKPF